MDKRYLLDLQTKRGAKTLAENSTSIKTFEAIKGECRKNIEDKSGSYRNLNTVDKKSKIKDIITEYVMINMPLVDGYMTDNKPDTVKLLDKLVEDITDYGILTGAINDDDVFEIRGNGKEIKIEVKGHVQDLRDKEGNIVSFSSPEEQEIILKKLLGDIRLTPKDALVNARTIEGFRIAAIHESSLGRDPDNLLDGGYHAFVLRKFRKSKMRLSEIVLKRTMSDNMARLSAVLPSGGLTFMTCGPTSSGKSSTNNAILQETPDDLRVILAQNPSEIDLRYKDAKGRVYNDVLHIEAREVENPRPQDATMENIMSHILRLSPTLVTFGEFRTNREFSLGNMIIQAGHPVNGTYHARNSDGAMQRFLTAHMASSGETIETALESLVQNIDIIIIQKILRDGTRRILQISEVVGVDPSNRHRALLNDLYIFKTTGDTVYDSEGHVLKIPGIHKRVGKLSQKTIDKLEIEGIRKSRFDFLLKEPDESEIESYTGVNISKYGM